MSLYHPIASGLSAAKTGFDLIKGLREVLKQDVVDHKEVANRLMEIQQLLLNAQEDLNTAGTYIQSLESDIEQLKRMAEFGSDFESSEGVYWRESFPYCPVCWDVDRKPVRLAGPQKNPMPPYIPQWSCPFHKVSYVAKQRK